MKKKICVVTSSRADYGLLCWVMKEIERSPILELIPIVTGMHLSKRYGYTINEILEDGFRNLVRIKILDEDTSSYGIAQSMSKCINSFAEFFKKNKVDFLILLGDRFETLSVALAAMPYNIPVGHIGGGEITEGAMDDNIRHCLTKLSHFHFPISEECALRIKKMGEEPCRIKVTGSPRLDFMNNVKFKSRQELGKKFGIRFEDKVGLVIFHPATLEIQDTQMQINNLLKAITAVNIEIIMFYPNLDVHSDIIIKSIEKFAENNAKVKLFKPLKRDDYLSLLNVIDIVIGNSSSGIVEAPSFRLPAVNIGNRQKGRDRVGNVIDTGYFWQDIVKGIQKGLYDEAFIASLKDLKNPYGDGKASKRIAQTLEQMDLDNFNMMKKACF